MKNLLGITMGCPVGIGPEIILRFFAAAPASLRQRLVVLGDTGILTHASRHMDIPARIVPWRPGMEPEEGAVPVMELSSLPAEELRWGRPDERTGRAMARYIEEGAQMAMEGAIDGLVTCPITKRGLQMAGYSWPGHTEMLAELTGAREYLMMMAGGRLKVVLVTIHEPLRRVPDLLTKKKIRDCIGLTIRSLRGDFGCDRPRVAVAALNPHAGEGGIFGDEEERLIAPVIEEWREKEALVSGPWPPDTVFHRAVAGEFDVVVAMYHDQGLIPFKLVHFSDGVNVTLGLPIVRTSVDHGTAYDIAGKGRADCASLRAAVELGLEMIANRNRADTARA
ncbi:MAG: 4-hydroxythreonine-4-phosphate dehydrogenase PdxA [Desulfobulbaceae bacterium]